MKNDSSKNIIVIMNKCTHGNEESALDIPLKISI